MALRVRTFAHIHELSIAEQTEEKRGVFVARVTADVDMLAQFMEWGGVRGSSIALVFGARGADVRVLVAAARGRAAGDLPLLWSCVLQGLLTQAYDRVRTRVGEMLSEFSESLMGAAVVRAYGLEDQTNPRVKESIDDGTGRRSWRTARGLDLPDGGRVRRVRGRVDRGVGALFGPSGVSRSADLAFIFLSDSSCTCSPSCRDYADTQTAIAGWRKVLTVLDMPIEIVEPDPGRAARRARSRSDRALGVRLP